MSATRCGSCGDLHPASAPCPSRPDPRIGSVLGGKYEIVRLIGSGGMGKVYEARHSRIGRRVALKFLLPQFAGNPDIVRRFETEARAAGSLEHENIAAVHDFGQCDDGARFLVMDFLSGEDCEHLLAREGRLPVSRAVDIVVQVCRGLAVVHEIGIIHRDLKPANLFLTRRADGTDLVKILDFGVAKLRSGSEPSATASGTPIGTAHYMSPEQARGNKDLDRRTDVYALGVILYELLSGCRPHTGETYLEVIYSILNHRPEPLEARRPDLPSGLAVVVARAMYADPRNRPASTAELEDALIPFAATRTVRTGPASLGPRTLPSPTDRDDADPPGARTSTTAPVTPTNPSQHSRTRDRKWLVWATTMMAILFGAALWIRQQRHPATQAGAGARCEVHAADPPPTPAAVSRHPERPDIAPLSSPPQTAEDRGRAARGQPGPRHESKPKSLATVLMRGDDRAQGSGDTVDVRGRVDIHRDPNF